MKQVWKSIWPWSSIIPAGMIVGTLVAGGNPTRAMDTRRGDDAATARKVNSLRLIWGDVEANPLGSDKRKGYLREFLSRSSPILQELSGSHSSPGAFWTLRAI